MNINNLNYLDINNLSLCFDKQKITFVIGSNNCGKSLLFKVCSGEVILKDTIIVNEKYLNKKEDYNNISVVTRVNENSFYHKMVFDELMYYLRNNNYSNYISKKIIMDKLELFGLSYVIDKKINDLDIYEKQKLLVVIGIINNPKVLLMDNPLDILKKEDALKIMNIIKNKCINGLSVVYFSNNLNYGCYSDKILLLNNYQCIGEYCYSDLYSNDKIFYDNNIEIPFSVDLNIKLKMYNLIDRNYDDLKVLVDNIWD